MLRLRVGDGEIEVDAAGSAPGTTLRVQLLARDVIVSTRMPELLERAQSLEGRGHRRRGRWCFGSHLDRHRQAGGDGSIGGGGPTILARVTKAATRELALVPGKPVWALVKSVSLRGLTSPAFPDG